MSSKPLSPEEISQKSDSNFVPSFWFLPKFKRQELHVIYAYCRLTDDIVDSAGEREINCGAEVSQASLELERWRKETMKSFQQKNDQPVLQKLSAIVQKYQIPHDDFNQLIDGIQMDLEMKSYKTFDDLCIYCYRVASIVGLICLEVFGNKNVKTKEYAVNLGIAFQLTNILRDIKTDAVRGRVYIPEEDLQKFAFKRENILSFPSSMDSDSFKNLIAFECERAGRYYKKARENLVEEDRANLIAAEVMCAVYHSILLKMKRNPLSILEKKVKLSKWEQRARILQGWISNRLRL